MYLVVEDGESVLLGLVAVVDEGDVPAHPTHVVEVHQGCVKAKARTLKKMLDLPASKILFFLPYVLCTSKLTDKRKNI